MENYILNAQTGRMIKKHGRVYNRLVNDGVIDGIDKNILYKIIE